MKATRCAQCKVKFTDEQKAANLRIHYDCVPAWLNAHTDKKARARLKREAEEKKADRAETKRRKADSQTVADLIEVAQGAFNAFIRARDEGKPCICCGKPMELDVLGQPKVNAGHWRSRGAAGHLRFDEANCHAQRVSCNRPGGAKAGPFREGMVARVGLSEVERLEADNEVIKWDRETLRQIAVIYRARLRELKKGKA